jgi:IS30 family transposase
MGILGRNRLVAEREVFWRLRKQGVRTEEIADLLGIHAGTARGWVIEHGGIVPRPAAPPSGRFLTADDREILALRKAAGATNAAIARELGKHPSSIGREIKRNSDPLRGTGHVRREYVGSKAHKRAVDRTRRPKPAKLRRAVNPELHDYVQAKLTLRWSPEQIVTQLPIDFPDRAEMRVSHETIYQALYVQGRGALRRELAACLRTGRAVRRPHKSADARRTRIVGMINISERPAEAEDRAVPGHWEGDLIIGKDSASAIGTLVERTTRFCMLLHLPGRHGAEDIERAMLEAIRLMPEELRRSLTWDQGSEMANHAEITIASGLDIFFCDPHSPWQRGSNENTNGLLRQYFPKGTDLSVHSAQHLRDVAAELNGRPRKTLGWRSPHKALNELLVATAA